MLVIKLTINTTAAMSHTHPLESLSVRCDIMVECLAHSTRYYDRFELSPSTFIQRKRPKSSSTTIFFRKQLNRIGFIRLLDSKQVDRSSITECLRKKKLVSTRIQSVTPLQRPNYRIDIFTFHLNQYKLLRWNE